MTPNYQTSKRPQEKFTEALPETLWFCTRLVRTKRQKVLTQVCISLHALHNLSAATALFCSYNSLFDEFLNTSETSYWYNKRFAKNSQICFLSSDDTVFVPEPPSHLFQIADLVCQFRNVAGSILMVSPGS